MRIAFLGSGAFGLPTLQSLATNHTLVGVVSQPDKPAGRGMALAPTPIAAWTAEHLPGVPLLKPADINEPSVLAQVRSWPVDAWVIIAFGQKLSESLIADRFAINLHASLLPRWRGAAPINAAILAGDTITGNSVITIAQRMDAGLVLGQSRRTIESSVTAGELHDLLSADGPALVEQVLANHAAGRTQATTQVEAEVTKARKLSRADAWIDFTKPADQARCRVHGLTPWPGITARIGDRDVKLLRVASLQASGTPSPGTLVDPAQGLIACGSSTALKLLEVQPAGGRPMLWADFMRGGGRTLSIGTCVQAGTPPCP